MLAKIFLLVLVFSIIPMILGFVLDLISWNNFKVKKSKWEWYYLSFIGAGIFILDIITLTVIAIIEL